MVANGHSGHKSDPSVAVLTPAAKGLTPMVWMWPLWSRFWPLPLLAGVNGFDVPHWIEYEEVNIMDKCFKPHKKTILHDYIGASYSFSIYYLLDKHFPMAVINQLKELFDFYKWQYEKRAGQWLFFHFCNSWISLFLKYNIQTKFPNTHKTVSFYQIIPAGNKIDKSEKWRYFTRRRKK